MKTLASLAAELKSDIESAIDAIELAIVLMGPNLGDDGEGAALRRALMERCASVGLVVLPEHKQLQAASEEAFNEGHNLCRYETELVKKADVVVLIPNSAGSIAELGMFSSQQDACRKTVILVSDEFKDEDSYLAGGPFQEARMNHAEVHFISYAAHEDAWAIVRRRIAIERGHRAAFS